MYLLNLHYFLIELQIIAAGKQYRLEKN